MPKKDIVVIGASAGGLSALISLVQPLPIDFKGSIFIVVHMPTDGDSKLDEILSNITTLKVIKPVDGQKIEKGTIYVPSNDHHILLEQGRILIKKGPRENRFRPSVDALFRSAAYVYGNRVIGVVLSGALNDGTSGLWSIKRMGGTSIVQQTEDADFRDMPRNAAEYVHVDYTLPAAGIGPVLYKLCAVEATPKKKQPLAEQELMKKETLIAEGRHAFDLGILNYGENSVFACPECQGVLAQFKQGKITRFRCHTGHAYSTAALLAALKQNCEESLWKAMRAMEETALILTLMQNEATVAKQTDRSKFFRWKASKSTEWSGVLHRMIEAKAIEDLNLF